MGHTKIGEIRSKKRYTEEKPKFLLVITREEQSPLNVASLP